MINIKIINTKFVLRNEWDNQRETHIDAGIRERNRGEWISHVFFLNLLLHLVHTSN